MDLETVVGADVQRVRDRVGGGGWGVCLAQNGRGCLNECGSP